MLIWLFFPLVNSFVWNAFCDHISAILVKSYCWRWWDIWQIVSADYDSCIVGTVMAYQVVGTLIELCR